MAQKDKVKRQFSIYWLFGKIGDILFIPILVISLFSSMSMLIQKKQNKPTSFFGYSLVNILSGSMTDAGLKKGDTVITEKCGVLDIELGDVIAFYEVRNDPTDTKPKILIKEYENPETIKTLNPTNNILYGDENITVTTYEKVVKENAYDVEYAQKNKKRIIFHMVIGIYVDEDGSVFYETKGTNSSVDSAPIRSDFIVGKYVNTPRFLRDAMSFCASPTGMIVLVCVPLSVLVMLQSFSLIKQIEVMNIEKQLIKGKKRFNDPDIKKEFNGNEMEIYNKAYLYYLTNAEEKENVLYFMWNELLEKEKPSKKEQKLLALIEEANLKLKTSKKDYWQVWIDGSKGFNKKKLKQYYEEVAVYSVFNKTTQDKTAKENKVTTVQELKKEEIEKTINAIGKTNSAIASNVGGKTATKKAQTTATAKNSETGLVGAKQQNKTAVKIEPTKKAEPKNTVLAKNGSNSVMAQKQEGGKVTATKITPKGDDLAKKTSVSKTKVQQTQATKTATAKTEAKQTASNTKAPPKITKPKKDN